MGDQAPETVLAVFMAETRAAISQLQESQKRTDATLQEGQKRTDATLTAQGVAQNAIQIELATIKTRLAVWGSLAVFVGPAIFALISKYLTFSAK